MIVAVDFDGTLVENTDFPELKYKLKQNAKDVILRLSKKNIKFLFFSARHGWYRIPAILFIKKEKLPIKILLFNKKPFANLYIDNQNIFCEQIDWLKIEKEIERKANIL